MIVTFVLPKRAVTESEGFLGLVGRESFQGSRPLCQGNELSSEQVNMIRHDHKGMQLAALETHITVQQRLDNQRCDVRAFQVQRSGSAFIESAVHCHERFAGSGNLLATKAPCGGQTSVQTERNELM